MLQQQPIATVNVTTFSQGEAGLLGLSLDPDFDTNKMVYIYYTYTNSTGQILNRISRLTENNGQLGNETVLLDGIRGASIHDGGRLKIGPDGKLYATTGDAGNRQLSLDLSSLNGKILRLNLNGTVPIDNPDPTSPVYSYGHRHPQGLAWDTAGHLVASEHGPTGVFPNPCCNDEINLILPGHNYGWPVVYGTAGDPSFTDPILSTGSATWAPSGMTFYSASKIPEWRGKFLVATLRGRHLRVLDIRFTSTPQVVSSTAFFTDAYGRLRDVVQGPDGYVYVATSNRDGRGTANQGDDKILKITAASSQPFGSLGFATYLLYIFAVGGAVGLSLLVVIRLQSRRRDSATLLNVKKLAFARFILLSWPNSN